MKRHYYFYLVYLFSLNLISQNTYIPDDNFEQLLIGLGYDSGPLDNYVSTNNINGIKYLKLNVKEISDLTGIQDFIALENLEFTLSKVTEVNIKTLVNLKYLNCNGNNLLKIDVSNNKELIDLFLGENSISEIDISNNIKLQKLDISENNFKEIDISNNPELLYLNTSDNNISELDITNNLKLTYFYCFSNNISNLDLKNHKELFDISCGDNPLNTISLSLNGKLNNLNIQSTFIYELDLRTQPNLISHPASFLNIENNPNLKCVFVDDVSRFDTDIWDAIKKDTHNTFVLNETECAKINCKIDVDMLSDVSSCDNFKLPNLVNGSYYTQSNGNGTKLNAGDFLTTSQTIFIYNEDPSNSACFNQTSFNINITQTPLVDNLSDVSSCANFELPNLVNGNYYTQSNGNGTKLNAGDFLTSSQTIFIYNEDTSNSACFNQTSFNINITQTPLVDNLSDVNECDNFELPNLVNGNYYTQSNKNGIKLNVGDIITTSQTIFIYNEDSSNSKCFNQTSFNINITQTPLVDNLTDVTEINSFILPSLTNGNYYTESNGNGTQLNNGDIITTPQTIFIYNKDFTNNKCFNETSFKVNLIIKLDIPSYFTPNNDGLNDYWLIKDTSQISEIFIFNRYGNLIAKPNINLGWNGYSNGKLSIPNSYWYLITLKSGKKIRGHFSLL